MNFDQRNMISVKRFIFCSKNLKSIKWQYYTGFCMLEMNTQNMLKPIHEPFQFGILSDSVRRV